MGNIHFQRMANYSDISSCRSRFGRNHDLHKVMSLSARIEEMDALSLNTPGLNYWLSKMGVAGTLNSCSLVNCSVKIKVNYRK